jgi:hypothetical protein
MKILIAILITATLSNPVFAKCTLQDFKGDWQVLMTFSQLEAPDGIEVAQRGGEITCGLRFDKRGQYIYSADNSCYQTGLNYPFGQIQSARVIPSPNAGASGCYFDMELDFKDDGIQIVKLPRVRLTQSKSGFAAGLDVMEPEDEIWHAGSSWGYKPAR